MELWFLLLLPKQIHNRSILCQHTKLSLNHCKVRTFGECACFQGSSPDFLSSAAGHICADTDTSHTCCTNCRKASAHYWSPGSKQGFTVITKQWKVKEFWIFYFQFSLIHQHLAFNLVINFSKFSVQLSYDFPKLLSLTDRCCFWSIVHSHQHGKYSALAFSYFFNLKKKINKKAASSFLFFCAYRETGVCLNHITHFLSWHHAECSKYQVCVLPPGWVSPRRINNN